MLNQIFFKMIYGFDETNSDLSLNILILILYETISKKVKRLYKFLMIDFNKIVNI